MPERIAQNDLEFFTEYLGYDNAPFHKNWYDFLQYDFSPLREHPNAIKKFHIEAPRGHAKTECVAINYPSWLIGKYPNININIVTKTADLAESESRTIKTRIESDKKYISIFGDLKPKYPRKWTDKQFIIKRDEISKNPTIKATGLMGPITGGRSDLIICDDVIDEENIRTRLQLEKVDTWFTKILIPTLFPWGAIIVIGTRWSYNDLYRKLLETWPNKVYKAIIDEASQEVLWPNYWPYDKLVERRKEIGTIIFNCQYQNDPTGYEGDLLKSSWLHYWDVGPPGHVLKFAGIDPAGGEGDQSSIATFGYDSSLRKGYLIDVWAERIPFPLFLRKIVQSHELYNYSKMYVETNAFQSVLLNQQELEGLPLVGTQTSSNKEQRFISMSSHFEALRILVNPLLYNGSFWTEWVQFPRGQYDDALDAVEIVVRKLFRKREGVFI